MLLIRDNFRNSVFKRDNYKCVICDSLAQDAHHIIERRLFDNGGYYIQNGASLCGKCHIKAEQTVLSCEEIREAANIEQIVLPVHLYREYRYDKWGNIILPNGQRLRGELFYDESVQKILRAGRVLEQFSKYVKYPRTWHLPWSKKKTKDDRVLQDVSYFEKKRVIVSIKLDGENCSMYNDYLHARSLDSNNHPSRNWIKNFHSKIAYQIPEDWRVCGENLYAEHSISYQHLSHYFQVFSIWSENNYCLNWDETVEWCELLDLQYVPVLYDGLWNKQKIQSLYQSQHNGDQMEGYVVRVADSFSYGDFKKSVAKYVSNDFEIVHDHWTKRIVNKNQILIK